MTLNYLWILSLKAIFIIGRVKEVDSFSVSAFTTTGVVAKLEALNTTALLLTWDSEKKSDDIVIDQYEIIIADQTPKTIESNNETDLYDYTITDLNPGVNYSVTLVVSYTIEFHETTAGLSETINTLMPSFDWDTVLLNYTESGQRESKELNESICLFNNTFPETPSAVDLTWRNEQTLTFTWYQKGQADTCYMWTDGDSNTTSDCSFDANETATGTITDLPVAGRNYTVYIVAASGGLSSMRATTYDRTLPSKPDSVSCFNVSTTFLQINITSSPETHETEDYRILYYISGKNNLQNITAGNTDTSTTIDVDSLEPGYTYVIEVFAQTSGLESIGSTNTSCETMIPMPSNVELYPVDTSTLLLTWKRPLEADDNLLLGFTITWDNDNTDFVNVTVNETQYDYNVTDLKVPGQLYRVSIGANYTEIGTSQFVNVTQNTYPEAPPNVTMTGRTSQKLSYTWHQIGVADTCYVSANSTNGTCEHLNGTFSVTIDNLPSAGSNYAVTIEAVSGGLKSTPTMVYDRTLPPNPNAPECTSKTNDSLTITISAPNSQSLYELDGYDVIVQSLVDIYPHDRNRTVAVDESDAIRINELVAGVTYNITVITKISDIPSSGSNSSNCTTELNIPLINDFVDTKETTIEVGWQKPDGYFHGFNVSCIGKNSAKNISAIVNATEGESTSATCTGTTAGALYEVNVASIIFDPHSASNSSESVSNVTVPFAPMAVMPSNATTNFIQISVNYSYSSFESQCTHYELTDLTQNKTYLVNEPIAFGGLGADSLYNISTFAISNYTQSSPVGDTSLWRRSYNSVPTSAWTLAPSVSNLTELERSPWSLLVQFDQTDPHDHVWQYMIHVDTDMGRFKTIKLTCEDVLRETTLTTFNCDADSDVHNEIINTTCRKQSTCTSTSGITEVTQVQNVPLVTEIAQVKVTLVKGVKETANVPVVTSAGTNMLTPVGEVEREASSILEDNSRSDYITSEVLSICYNISDLDPYVSYTISVQAVNPGGCSNKITEMLMTEEWIPGCVNITYLHENYDSVELHWNPPDKPNGVITQYVISYTKQDDVPKIETTNYTFHILSSLESYVFYNITVAAETRVGVGEIFGCPISTISARTRIGPPYAPVLNGSALNATSINISWTLKEDIETGPETYYNLTIVDTENITWVLEEHVEGFNNRSIVVENLDEYWNYSVTIVAYTLDENGTALTTNGTNVIYVRTLESTPGPVQSFKATSLSDINECYKVRVEWTEPTDRDRNGIIQGYLVEWSKVGSSNVNIMTFIAEPTTRYVTVEPNGQAYNFTIRAVTSAGPGTVVETFVNSTGFCAPAPVDAELAFSVEDSSTTTFTVIYDPEIFRDNSNGPVIASALLVAEEGDSLANNETYGNLTLLNGTLTWSEAIVASPVPEYRPTPDSWLSDSSGSASSRLKRELSGKYIVGKDEMCSKDNKVYCNGPLPPGRSFRVRGLICTQVDQCYKTLFSTKIFITIAVTQGEDLAWIAGVVIGVLALIALIACLVYFFVIRRRDYGSESSDKRENGFGFPLASQEMTRAVRICDFSARVAEMHRNSDLEFNDEYQAIQNQSAKHPWRAAEKPQNRIKNRFVNILPFDHSRVMLQTADDDDSESDYINANYIPGGRGIREFIACQGPLQGTIDDFWQMIWEQGCRVIVMLTNVREKGREKCAQYWPEAINEPSSHGEVDVNLSSVSQNDYYVVRKFNVSMGPHVREVLQFHFTSWPDFGVPTDPEKLISFVREVRKQAGNNVDPPMAVHCSAGVGRTGTFIVLDRLLRELPRENTIDIFKMVLEVRDHRCLMVQTEAQYVFIHDCIKLEIEKMLGINQAYQADDEHSFNDEPIYQNSNQVYHDNEVLQSFK